MFGLCASSSTGKAQDPSFPIISGKDGMSGPDPRRITLFDVDVGQPAQLQTIRLNIHATEGPIDAYHFRYKGFRMGKPKPEYQPMLQRRLSIDEEQSDEDIQNSHRSRSAKLLQLVHDKRPQRDDPENLLEETPPADRIPELIKEADKKIQHVASVERSLEEIEYILDELTPHDAYARGYATHPDEESGASWPSAREALRKLLTAFPEGSGGFENRDETLKLRSLSKKKVHNRSGAHSSIIHIDC